ncbi:MAG: MFS transporter, partial [Pseudomonadota bacterium]
GLYMAQSLTGSMVITALPVILREQGVSLDIIGYLSVLFLPWALKFLWAPLVDRHGRMRSWILCCQAALIICYILASFLSPDQYLSGLAIVVLAMALFAATQDIATDAVGVYSTTTKSRSLASGSSTIGGFAGFLIGGGLCLWIYAHYGWFTAMITLATCMTLLTVPTFLLGKAEPTENPDQTQCKSRVATLRSVFQNKALISGLGFLIFWQLGVRLGNSMTGPMLIDAGMDIEQVALVRGTIGTVAGLVAAIIGTFIARKIGTRNVLILAGLLLILNYTGIFIWTLLPMQDASILAALHITLAAITALSFIAVYAVIMDWCSPQQVATDFAVLQSLDAALAVVVGMGAGLLAEQFGYAPLFIISVLVLLPSLVRITRFIRPDDAQSVTAKY